MSSCRYSFPILTDAGMYRQILVKIPNVKFRKKKNPRPVGMLLVRVDIRAMLGYYRSLLETVLITNFKNYRISLFFTGNDCPFIAKYKKPHKSVPCHRRRSNRVLSATGGEAILTKARPYLQFI